MARLVKHRIASPLVDLLYNDFATATQRAALMRELYGNVHALKLAENEVHSLLEALSVNSDRKKVILDNLTELLTTLTSKWVVPIYSYICYVHKFIYLTNHRI